MRPGRRSRNRLRQCRQHLALEEGPTGLERLALQVSAGEDEQVEDVAAPLAYLNAVENAFGANIDYAVLQKITARRLAARRATAPLCASAAGWRR